jgi:hypothetical protein
MVQQEYGKKVNIIRSSQAELGIESGRDVRQTGQTVERHYNSCKTADKNFLQSSMMSYKQCNKT